MIAIIMTSLPAAVDIGLRIVENMACSVGWVGAKLGLNYQCSYGPTATQPELAFGNLEIVADLAALYDLALADGSSPTTTPKMPL